MAKKILVVDDSALMRRVLSDIIGSDKRFILAECANNGLEAFNLITLDPKKYDAVILDINMPKMTGIELLEKLRALNVSVRIIVVSTVAIEGARETIKCLELGAFDFVTKPDAFMEAKSDQFRDRIISVLECATDLGAALPRNRVSATKMVDGKEYTLMPYGQKFTRRPHKRVSENAKRLVAIASSTGGPRALQSVIPKLPKNLKAPVLVVQHMPAGFTGTLAQRLDELSALHVKEAEDGEVIKAGTVYIAKGGTQMRLKKPRAGCYCISLTADEPARNGLKPCADIMYESLDALDFDEITCAVLTGMGSDGTKGIAKLNEKRNLYVISQDEASCTVYGMPKALFEAGLSDTVVELDRVADAITKNVGVQ